MRLKLYSVIIAAVLLVMGCQGTNQNQEGRGAGDNTFERTRTTHDYGNQTDRNRYDNSPITQNVTDRNRNSNNRASNNRQDQYDVSEEAADRIVDKIAEIDRAYVLTTKNNAYVAAILDENNTTRKDNLSYNDRQNSSSGMNIRNVNDRNVKDRTVNDGDANKRKQDNHMANRRNENTSDDIGRKRDVESDDLTEDR